MMTWLDAEKISTHPIPLLAPNNIISNGHATNICFYLSPEVKECQEINIRSSTWTLGSLSLWLSAMTQLPSHPPTPPPQSGEPTNPLLLPVLSSSVSIWVLEPRKCSFLLTCQYLCLFPPNPYTHPYLACGLQMWCWFLSVSGTSHLKPGLCCLGFLC